MPVEMVGSDVENDRELGFEFFCMFKLKAGELGDINVVIFAFFNKADEGHSDVSGEESLKTCFL